MYKLDNQYPIIKIIDHMIYYIFSICCVVSFMCFDSNNKNIRNRIIIINNNISIYNVIADNL